MTTETVRSGDVDELIEVMREAASAYIAGDIRRYVELIRHTDDFTLLSPFGGEPVRDDVAGITEERIGELEAFFQGGDCDLDVSEVHASGDLAVLVAIERQQAKVGHLPPQDWSLRVTLVFRHEHGAWRLVHRHADPLVNPISFDQLAALARG